MVPAVVSPLLLLAFVLQAVFAILAAVGVWRVERWAAAASLLLGAYVNRSGPLLDRRRGSPPSTS